MAIRFNYDLRTLFVLILLFAVTLVLFRLLEVSLLITGVLMVFWVAFGLAVGWCLRPLDTHTSVISPTAAFLALNWTCWFFNRLSLNFVQDAPERDLTRGLAAMTTAHEAGWFELLALLITAALVCTAWRRSSRWVSIAGGVSLLLWTILAWTGYVNASISLIDLR